MVPVMGSGVAVVVWFKRDLRIHDHAALNAAVARAAELGVPVVPLYVVEPGYWALPDASGRHWDTTAEGLDELRADLGRLGAPLIVRVGDVVDILLAFHTKHGMSALFSHEEVGNAWTFARDKRVAAWASAQSIPWHEHRQAPVLRAMKGGEDWEEWRLSFLHAPSLRPPTALQGLADLDPRAIPTSAQLGITDHCPGRQPGGRRAGVACLTSFLTERGEGYRWAISKPDAAEHAGGRISPHLAYGTLSVREVHRGLRGRLGQNPGEGWEQSLDAFRQRVAGRDFFMQQFESNAWGRAPYHPPQGPLRAPRVPRACARPLDLPPRPVEVGRRIRVGGALPAPVDGGGRRDQAGARRRVRLPRRRGHAFQGGLGQRRGRWAAGLAVVSRVLRW